MIKYSLFTVYLLVVNIQDRLIVVVHHKEGRDLTQQKGHCVGFVGANSVIPTGYDVVAHHLWTTSYPLQQTLSKDSSSPTNWGESLQMRLAWIMCLEICCQLWEDGLVWLQRDFFPFFIVFWKQCHHHDIMSFDISPASWGQNLTLHYYCALCACTHVLYCEKKHSFTHSLYTEMETMMKP